MTEKRPVLRFKNGTAADLKKLTPTWARPDGSRQCPKCKRSLPLGAFFYARWGHYNQHWQPTYICQRCRQGRKRIRSR